LARRDFDRRRTHRRPLSRRQEGSADRLQAGLETPRQGRAFKRNDAMLATLPIGVLIFPGSGIQDNLGGTARILGIPVWRPVKRSL
jgi:hypothetical protein